jgi:hypothetical protein
MVAICHNKDFFLKQADVIRRCIEEDKWYLSEKAGRDVGWEAAYDHFMKTFVAGFAAGFRACYCGMICPMRQQCCTGQKYAVQ